MVRLRPGSLGKISKCPAFQERILWNAGSACSSLVSAANRARAKCSIHGFASCAMSRCAVAMLSYPEAMLSCHWAMEVQCVLMVGPPRCGTP